MKRKVFSLLVIGLLSQMVFAQDFDKARLDNYFQTLDANDKFMGSVAVSENGKIIYTNSIGFSDFENNIKANENSKYRIGSISKTFTTVLVLKAIEKRELELHQTIELFFPTIINSEKITIEQLLSHRSGINDFTKDEEYLTWCTQAKAEKEMVAIIAKGGSDFEPGSITEYSNSNFILLTYILEKTFKKSYAELLTEYITEPLGLSNTKLGSKINTKNNECNSYKFREAWELKSETDISIPLGAGGIVSTSSDLLRFSNALFGGELLEEQSLELMKPKKGNMGMGLFKMPFYDITCYGHNGAIDGFFSIFCYFEEGNISYAMTSNGTNFNNNDISIAVVSAILNRPYEVPEFKIYEVQAEDYDKYCGLYSSTQIPPIIKITKENNRLMAQVGDQPSFPLEASEKDKFRFDRAGLVLEFNTIENTMILKQGGGQYAFTKE